MSGENIGPNGKGSILPGIEGGQEKFAPPFLQACGLDKLWSGPGEFLQKITPPSIVQMANIQSVALLGKKITGVFSGKQR